MTHDLIIVDMEKYLKVSEVIDWQHPKIMECAKQIGRAHV